ncbi:hypothetical protein [Terribacillus saccharophilus]|uniref:hypothetical protein n=1 Tax=Terribacillus saccharophilus TaxID=361277 RepID=UPI0039827296
MANNKTPWRRPPLILFEEDKRKLLKRCRHYESLGCEIKKKIHHTYYRGTFGYMAVYKWRDEDVSKKA